MEGKKSLKERTLALLKLNNTPQEIALGVAIGVFIAILPLYGLHTIMVVMAALLVKRANKIAMLLGTNISLPPSVPFITWAGYSIGRWVLASHDPALSWSAFRGFTYKKFLDHYYPLFVGSYILGLACAVIFYFLTWGFMNRRRRASMKMPVFLAVVLMGLGQMALSSERLEAYDYKGEKVVYAIDPLGRAEYRDLGQVMVNGRKLNLVTFRTQVMGFDDTEKIYTDPGTLLPVRVERYITKWFGSEYLVEDYDQKKFVLTITKFINKKQVKGYLFKPDGPISNAVFLPFYLRTIPQIGPGWSLEVRFPDKFKVELVAIEEIQVPAGKFMAYHFTSTPHKFDIWISKDNLRVPLKIKGAQGLGYTLSMKEHLSK